MRLRLLPSRLLCTKLSSTPIVPCPCKHQSTEFDTRQGQHAEHTFMHMTQGSTLHKLEAWRR